MADLQPYRFEPERVPNAEDRESENEEVNDRFTNSLWLMFPTISMLMYETSSINYWGSIHVPYHVHTSFQMKF